MLEAMQYKDNAFVTLTYADEFLPSDMSVHPRHLQLFLKRLRKRFGEGRIRFYGVGEYGDQTQRPHYHLALFGFPACSFIYSRYSREVVNCCRWCDMVRDTWAMGNIFIGQLEAESSHYIAGYVIKKMTAPDDPRLKGRYPEFARMSLRPGIGAGMMDETASTLMFHELEKRLADVPSALRHGDKELPLGRYLRRRLRERIGREPGEPKEVQIERNSRLLALYNLYEGDTSRAVAQYEVERSIEKEQNEVRSRAAENRYAIHRKGKRL